MSLYVNSFVVSAKRYIYIYIYHESVNMIYLYKNKNIYTLNQLYSVNLSKIFTDTAFGTSSINNQLILVKIYVNIPSGI